MQIPDNPFITSLKLQFLACFHESVHCIITNNLLKSLITNTRIPTNQQISIPYIDCCLKDIVIQFFSDKVYEKIYIVDFSSQCIPKMMLGFGNRKQEQEIEDQFVEVTDTTFRIKKTDLLVGFTVLFDFRFLQNQHQKDKSRKETMNMNQIHSIIKKNIHSVEKKLCQEYLDQKRKELELIQAEAERKQKQKNMKQRKRKNRHYVPISQTSSKFTSANKFCSPDGTIKSIEFRKKIPIKKEAKQKNIEGFTTNFDSIKYLDERSSIFRANKSKFMEEKGDDTLRLGILSDSFHEGDPFLASSKSIMSKQFQGMSSGKMMLASESQLKKREDKDRLATIQSKQSNYLIDKPDRVEQKQSMRVLPHPNNTIINTYLKSQHKKNGLFRNDWMKSVESLSNNIYREEMQKMVGDNLWGKQNRIKERRTWRVGHRDQKQVNITMRVSKLDSSGQWQMRKTHRIVLS